MPVDLIVDLDDDLIAAMQRLADANGRSLEDEHRSLLDSLVLGASGSAEHRARFAEHAKAVRALTAGRDLTPSETLVREARQRG